MIGTMIMVCFMNSCNGGFNSLGIIELQILF